MTITDHPTTDLDPVPATGATTLRVPLDRLAPHPDNVRRTLGDLTELVRSIRSHGVLVPLTVLPADGAGIHLVVAGHRRLAASHEAPVADLPIHAVDLTPAQVIEAMLTENGNRSDLTITDEIVAIEKLLGYDPRLSAAKMCKRIGHSQAWCRSRMALTVLPNDVRGLLDRGDLTISQAEATATLADLGPDHMSRFAVAVNDGYFNDADRAAHNYRGGLQRAQAWREAIEEARNGTQPVHEHMPDGARRLHELFQERKDRTRHAKEDCHAVVVKETSWGSGFERYDVCTQPRRHKQSKPSRNGADTSGALNADVPPDREDQHARQRGRKARVAYGAEVFARTKGGPKAAPLTQLAMTTLIHEAGQEALKYAAVLLGVDPSTAKLQQAMLELASGSASDLARVAGAVAYGHGETRTYWSHNYPPTRAWTEMLVEHGWTPDPWTQTHLLANPGNPAGDDGGAYDGGDDPEADPAA